MKTLVVLFYFAFATVLLPGQTPSPDEAKPHVRNPVTDRLGQLPKSFPPELAAPVQNSAPLKRMRSFCVYPNLATGSLSIKPCGIRPGKFRVWPSFENILPKTKPVTPPGDIR
jgi:hypothetical protein